MVLSTPIAYARAQAQTDSNGLTDAKAIIWANEALQDFHRELVTAGVDASQVQEAYQDGTANTGTYLYPTDMLFLKAMELNYANTSAQDYKVATQVDVSNLPLGGFGYLRVNANPALPNFDDHGDWFEIFPTPTTAHNTSRLMRIFYFKQPTAYTATSDTVSYPENLDQAILGWRIAASYLYSLQNPESMKAADNFYAKYQQRVKEYISFLARGSQMPVQATPLQIDGFQY